MTRPPDPSDLPSRPPDQHASPADSAIADGAFEESLARVGAPLRHRASLPEPTRTRFGVFVLLALSLMACAVTVVFLRPTPQAWEVQVLAGQPTIDGSAATSQLREAQSLATGERERAMLTVPSIGTVTLEPNSRVRLVRSSQTQQRLQLARGTLHAFITAPPRLFVVDTPAARAIDMGCAYTLTVEDDGSTLLRVALGWVELAAGERNTRVSSGIECRTSPTGRVGIPRAIASSLTPEQLDSFDPAGASDAGLDGLLASCGQIDAVTLWHLLQRVPMPARARVLDRLAALQPTPKDAPRDRTLALDSAALEAWWNQVR